MIDLASEEFVLIGGDVVYACSDGGLPPFASGGDVTEVIAVEPAVTAKLVFRRAIESVEPNPQAVRMSALYQGPKAAHLLGCPFACMLLASGLDHPPGIVPPAAIVSSLFGIDQFWRCVVVLLGGVHRSKG